uniref:Transposable element P transposase-like RNase H domain-containing protein n=1 Tax=Glossina austeni TaxID=7395 RepID=A0A1A9UD66_GLOAU
MSIKMARKRPSTTPMEVPEELQRVTPRDVPEEEGPFTSPAPAQSERNQRPLQAEQIHQEDFVVEVEVLREVVNKLTPQDKIVQLSFDEVHTNGQTTYSRAKNVLYGCGYRLVSGSKAKFVSQPYRTILVFGVRSILTAFNVLLYASITQPKGNPQLLLKVIKIAENVGLDVKAVVCDRIDL